MFESHRIRLEANMARMMGAVILHREYCRYGCCPNVPPWKFVRRARRVQRAREKRNLAKEIRAMVVNWF